MDPDPTFKVNAEDLGFWWPKPEKSQLEKFMFSLFFQYNNCKLILFSTFVGHFCPPGPDPATADQTQCGSMRIRIPNVPGYWVKKHR